MSPSEFYPEAYGPVLAELLVTDRCRGLGPGTPEQSIRPRLDALGVDAAFAHARLVDRDMARLCLGALWLLYDWLEPSHEISQSVASSSGSYWHGIMHRREPDYDNAKYWFRRVGRHPVFVPLAAEAQALAQAHKELPPQPAASGAAWDPLDFVDLCRQGARSGGTLEQWARQVAQREWELLFDHCYRAAIGQQD